MSWGLGSWKRPSDTFRLSLHYGEFDLKYDDDDKDEQYIHSGSALPSENNNNDNKSNKIELEWSASEDEEQAALKLQSQLMVALPPPQEHVNVEIHANYNKKCDEHVKENDEGNENENENDENVGIVEVGLKVIKRREPLVAMSLSKTVGSGQQSDGIGVLSRMLRSCRDHHWGSTITFLNLSSCGLMSLPIEINQLPLVQKLHVDNNRLTSLPAELGELHCLRVLKVDHNMLGSVPVELKQCVGLVELSLEYNKLVRPLLDFRAMTELRILRLFGNPLEFLPEILPLSNLRHLSLANVRIEGNKRLSSVDVKIEMENSSYFASRHKLSAFFSLVFRFSSCQHPLLASALAKITQDNNNRTVIGKDENAVKQLISMMSSDNRHVVEQACSALSSLASDPTLAMLLMKADILQPIETVLKSTVPEELISVLNVVINMAFASDTVSSKMLNKEVLKYLKKLCGHEETEVQRLALLAVGNLAFCGDNRRILVTSESLRELLIHLAAGSTSCVSKAAARALAILGENESLRRALKGKPIGKQGLRILAMDGGGMKGLATVQMLRRIEKGTGKRIHEIFDLICGTSTGGMLAVALGIKHFTLDHCEEIYKKLGKLVFAEPTPKDNEAATWREKLDQLYKSSSQNFRVVVHGSKHSAEQFERLLREMCVDEEGDLLIDSAVKSTTKVFIVSSLVSAMPARPFVFRNYQYPAGTAEVTPWTGENSMASSATTSGQTGQRSTAFAGSCKYHVWQAIRASSAAPYYLDDYAYDGHRWQDGAIVANNPTLIAIREAQLLWPDTPIGCLVSVGCGSVPTKPRGRGGWRYLDTGQVLIESACSVERVEEALDTLLPMLPDIQYYRFNPVDERCGMELDETDPSEWVKLEAATEEYIHSNIGAFLAACKRLLPPHHEEEFWPENARPYQFLSKTKTLGSVVEEIGPCLGWRRKILIVEACQSSDILKSVYHVRGLETFCTRHGIKLELLSKTPELRKSIMSATTPFNSPLFTGSFPASPLLFSPERGHQHLSRIDLVPPLNLDGLQSQVNSAKTSTSPPKSPPLGPRQFSGPLLSLKEKLQSSPLVGIVHFALQCDLTGMILGWRNDVFVVAEPGALAVAFLENVRTNMCFSDGEQSKRNTAMPKISSISELVARYPRFQINGVLHRFIGRQTQVMADDQEIGAYMFQRTLPAMHITAEDVRCMVGAWRDRIIICSGKYGPPATVVKAFLDSGAKAVIASSIDTPDLHSNGIVNCSASSMEKTKCESGNFVIGEDEEEEETELSIHGSEWDSDSDLEGYDVKTENEEMLLSSFICTLYDNLYREGVRADIALQNALNAHPKQHYSCHLLNN